MIRSYFYIDYNIRGPQSYMCIIQDIKIGTLAKDKKLKRLVHLEEVHQLRDRYMLKFNRPYHNLRDALI
jgi:hypothetical protein